MYKEFKIFEIIQNDLNQFIHESLGISDAVTEEARRICNLILDDISSANKTLVASGVGYRSGNTKTEVFKNSKTIKDVNIPTVNIDFRWEYYNFKNKEYRARFLEKNNINTNGNSVLIINPLKKNNKNNNGFVTLTIFSTSGNIDQNSFIDTISHELRHILETDIPSKQFSNRNLMSFVNTNLQSQNYYTKLIAEIIYFTEKHEITGFMQGFYDFISTEKWKYGSVDNAIEHSEGYNTMLYLKERIIEAQKYMNDNDFINEIDKYKNFGINHNNFIKKANQQYKEIMKRIGKVIIKTKQDFITEGLHCGIDYLYFHTSFFKKKL